jgi:hypothetical protein
VKLYPHDPAFSPRWTQHADDDQMHDWLVEGHRSEGLTKRELFAAMAMQGRICMDEGPSDCAKQSLIYADALIAELNKEKP